MQYFKTQEMRYGENPHQKAAFYTEANPTEASVATAVQLQGKELSFNNIADTDAALECVKQFDQPACVIVKHANPCGVAVAVDINLPMIWLLPQTRNLPLAALLPLTVNWMQQPQRKSAKSNL